MRLVDAVGESGAIRSRSERSMPRTSWAAAATLWVTSASGSSAGSAARAASVETSSCGDDEDPLDAFGRGERTGRGCGPPGAGGHSVMPP